MKIERVIADYEHSGDLNYAKQRVKKEFPYATNIEAWEERDHEAESEYVHEYGELDEPIYQGYISFEVPEKYYKEVEDFWL